MKKGLAIFLLAVTLYNIGGYLIAFQYFISKSDKFNEQQISKNRFKESDLVEIKIPVHLAGIDTWRGYERVSGSVQLAQNSYNYVRMKMTPDTIYLMCIPNYNTTRLYKDNVICAREVSDTPLSAKKQHIPFKNISIVKYVAIISATGNKIHQQEYTTSPPRQRECDLSTGTHDTPLRPPELFFA